MQGITAGMAAELVKTALAAGAIKLIGPNGAVDPSKRAGEADAAYLLTLLHHLTKPSGA